MSTANKQKLRHACNQLEDARLYQYCRCHDHQYTTDPVLEHQVELQALADTVNTFADGIADRIQTQLGSD